MLWSVLQIQLSSLLHLRVGSVTPTMSALRGSLSPVPISIQSNTSVQVQVQTPSQVQTQAPSNIRIQDNLIGLPPFTGMHGVSNNVKSSNTLPPLAPPTATRTAASTNSGTSIPDVPPSNNVVAPGWSSVSHPLPDTANFDTFEEFFKGMFKSSDFDFTSSAFPYNHNNGGSGNN
ncbi:unnamed protein product [Ambrosiozyma monospora]|uniref:Unnamed protein product n=1 Tax=Ambrosiozyma monospora TaxID=43982 RepID=A0ACB5U797_AMBMO|nr:unnamed protein product [Ambrosiozyma monospora]